MRVLVVEDQAAMADALGRGLRAEGFDVDVAPDGVDGLWRAREFPYDVIVLDVMLPGVNGYEICRTLRAERCATPILMLTAKDGEYDIAEGLELGADDYLTKPFSFVELVARVRALSRRASSDPTSSLLAAGPLALDPVRRRTCIDGHPIDLTSREFTLLEALVRRAGMPLTRRELLDIVWGHEHDAASNVVDVYIGYVRRKIADVTDTTVVETVRGVGYRVVNAA
ncbi:MAG: response regulator transcription factor [Actinomycetota bacterium]